MLLCIVFVLSLFLSVAQNICRMADEQGEGVTGDDDAAEKPADSSGAEILSEQDVSRDYSSQPGHGSQVYISGKLRIPTIVDLFSMIFYSRRYGQTTYG